MPKKDIILKELLSDPVRFADLFNGTLFQGEKILKPQDLMQLSNEIAVIIDDNKDSIISIQRFRDIIKKYVNGMEVLIYTE